jgi:hypothetical protein
MWRECRRQRHAFGCMFGSMLEELHMSRSREGGKCPRRGLKKTGDRAWTECRGWGASVRADCEVMRSRGAQAQRAARQRGSGAGVVTVTVSLAPVFQKPKYRAFRASLFAALGLWGIAPAFHSYLLHGAERAVRRAFAHDLAMGAIYLVRARAPASCRCSRWSHLQDGNAMGLAMVNLL